MVETNPAISGIELVMLERFRQETELCYDAEHDDLYNSDKELVYAAACYLCAGKSEDPDFIAQVTRDFWPWPDIALNNQSPIRNYVKSAALLIAEIDRLLREERRAT